MTFAVETNDKGAYFRAYVDGEPWKNGEPTEPTEPTEPNGTGDEPTEPTDPIGELALRWHPA